MPRDGSGIFSAPFPDVVAGTTIESAVHNGTIADFTDDANDPRPVIAGGTGAASASLARKNLAAEVRNVEVTNYDSHTFEAGSFWSKVGATGAPDNPSGASTRKFAGTCVIIDAETATPANRSIVITVREEGDTTIPGRVWIREKRGTAAWTNWHEDTGILSRYWSQTVTPAPDGTLVLVGFGGVDANVVNPVYTVDRETGITTYLAPISVEGINPSLNMGRIGVTAPMCIRGNQESGSPAGSGQRWQLDLGNNAAETGGNVGSDFVLNRFADNGAFLGIPFLINRASGAASFVGGGTTFAVTGGTAPAGYALNIGSYTSYAIGISPNLDNLAAVTFLNAFAVQIGNIFCTPTATQYNTTSDARLKEDLRSFDVAASAIVEATNVYDFKWKSTGERSYGIVAQEAADVYPAAVTHDEKNDWYGIDYSKYVPVILQELKALRARVAELEGRLASKPS